MRAVSIIFLNGKEAGDSWRRDCPCRPEYHGGVPVHPRRLDEGDVVIFVSCYMRFTIVYSPEDIVPVLRSVLVHSTPITSWGEFFLFVAVKYP